MYNHNKAQQSKNRVHISWNILYAIEMLPSFSLDYLLDVDWYDRTVFRFLRKIVTEVHPKNHR